MLRKEKIESPLAPGKIANHLYPFSQGWKVGGFVFTGGIAPQLYAQAFEQAGLDLSQPMHQDIFKNFLCFNGPDFYNLPGSNAVFTLTKTPQTLEIIRTKGGDITPLPLGLGNNVIPWSIKP